MTSIPLRIMLYVFIGSDPVNGGLKECNMYSCIHTIRYIDTLRHVDTLRYIDTIRLIYKDFKELYVSEELWQCGYIRL